MGYEVLARRYRSRNFDEIVGQHPIATTLKNAVTSGRIHHGYLFTGTRGVGKTSTARILAKCLNCFAFDAPTAEPCCECESCLRIAEGGDLDVVEIDAASNTGVDNIRDLRSNAAFRPARARYKVYIIDEVHMLSTGAFNALLKTLEEPPEHVKFILATTESHKVPATIRSRCQQFDFRSIGPAEIATQMNAILRHEEIEADDDVIRRVARLANGSMRDALSLLDQLLALGDRRLTAARMEEVLPSAHDAGLQPLMDAVTIQDPAAALLAVEDYLGLGHTPERLCEQAIAYLRSLMLLNVCGTDTPLVDVVVSVRETLAGQAQAFDGPTFVYLISLVEQVRRQLRGSAAPRPLLDAMVVRMAHTAAFSSIEAVLDQIAAPAATTGIAPMPKPASSKKNARG